MNILGTTQLVLVTEKSGLSFDLNPLETNLVNLVILIGVLVYFGSKTLSNLLTQRRNKIAEAIKEAEDNQKKAYTALTQEQEKLKQAQSQAEQIVQTAHQQAEKARLEIAQQAEKDIERVQETAVKDLSNEQRRVLAELRQSTAKLAVERAEGYLKENLNDANQQTLIERSIAQLGE